MDTPRTIVESKNRGKQAGIEMGFREYTGTFIAEFSAALFAVIASKFISKRLTPNVKVNSGSWITNNGLDVFSDIYNKSDKTLKGYVKDVLNSMYGLVGTERKNFSDIKTEKTEPIIDKLTNLISSENTDKKEYKKALNGIQDEIINLLGADNNITIKSDKNSASSNLSHALRDIVDSGRNIFFSETKQLPSEIISKLKRMNNLRIGIAIPLSMGLAITNQYLNRYLTKKRTGIDNFVGENGYENNVKDKNEKKKEKYYKKNDNDKERFKIQMKEFKEKGYYSNKIKIEKRGANSNRQSQKPVSEKKRSQQNERSRSKSQRKSYKK
jgi:hypothetical protein